MMLRLPIGDRYFEFAMRPVFDRYGSVTGAVPEAIDVTERRQSEDALRQAQKMEAIGQLTGGVAHDFNNLLTIIRSATDFLRRRDLPEDRRRRYVDAISDTVERAAKLTTQLLAFARRQPLKPQIFDVSDQVESLAQLIRPLVGSRIRVETDIADSQCFAIADIAQFETALINFAVNGRDAMHGEGQLTIGVRKVDSIPALRGAGTRPGSFVAISVHDSGDGIAPENLETIFEPFFTTKEVGKGSGLGLSMVYGFVKQSNGHVSVYSEPGLGTTVRMYLPARPNKMPAQPRERTDHNQATAGSAGTVLVVEDDPFVRSHAVRCLQSLGYAVIAAVDGNDALQKLAAEARVDVLFTDLVMPGGVNGWELADLAQRARPGLPVLLTSGYALETLIRHGHADGESLVLTKPYRKADLARRLREALNAAAAPR
jgi:signal transduction histidine kinase/ActR/RegA family two-component response regulator